VQVRGPVPLRGAADVALVVRRGVLVDLDYPHVGVIEMLLEPVGADEHAWVRVVGHVGIGPSSPGGETGTAAARCGRRVDVLGPEMEVQGPRCVCISEPAPVPGQHRRDGIMAATSPMHLVRTKSQLLGRICRCDTYRICHGDVKQAPPRGRELRRCRGRPSPRRTSSPGSKAGAARTPAAPR